MYCSNNSQIGIPTYDSNHTESIDPVEDSGSFLDTIVFLRSTRMFVNGKIVQISVIFSLQSVRARTSVILRHSFETSHVFTSGSIKLPEENI